MLANKILSKQQTYLFIAVIVQFWTLLKPFPDKLVSFCNFRVRPVELISVAVNCDSKDFLLDSQDLSRMINGLSPEMDRPLPALIIYFFSRALSAVGIPKFMIDYTGEDGIVKSYSALNYSGFVLLNFLVLLIAISMLLSLLGRTIEPLDFGRFVRYSLLGTFVISQNYITANFMWTPHTTVCSLLVPVFILRILIDNYVNKLSFSHKFFFLIVVLIFCHPLFIVPLFLIVLFSNFKGIKKVFLISTPIIFYISIPKLSELVFGSSTPNMSFTNYKRVLWIFDPVGHNLSHAITGMLEHAGNLIINGSWMIYLIILLQFWQFYAARVVDASQFASRSKGLVGGELGYKSFLSLAILAIFFVVVGIAELRHSIVLQVTIFLLIAFKNLRRPQYSRNYGNMEVLFFACSFVLIQSTWLLPRTFEY